MTYLVTYKINLLFAVAMSQAAARQFVRRVLPTVCRASRPICTIALRKLALHPTQQFPQLRNPNTISKRNGGGWTSDTILERIFYVLKSYDKVDPEKVHLDADLVKDLGLDSLDIVEVCYHMERSMMTWISDDERETIETVRDIWEVVMHKLLYKLA